MASNQRFEFVVEDPSTDPFHRADEIFAAPTTAPVLAHLTKMVNDPNDACILNKDTTSMFEVHKRLL
jgi:hypothetical protein